MSLTKAEALIAAERAASYPRGYGFQYGAKPDGRGGTISIAVEQFVLHNVDPGYG
jgi:hypothetical protein